jgi:hypothetical protein
LQGKIREVAEQRNVRKHFTSSGRRVSSGILLREEAFKVGALLVGAF